MTDSEGVWLEEGKRLVEMEEGSGAAVEAMNIDSDSLANSITYLKRVLFAVLDCTGRGRPKDLVELVHLRGGHGRSKMPTQVSGR